jgi:hypothetical protein
MRGLAATSVTLALVLVSCRTATEITLTLNTDAPCSGVTGTSISLDRAGAPETDTPATRTASCTSGSGALGSIVLVPSGARDAELVVRVVTALGVPLEACAPPAYGPGCIIARRRLRFVPHTSLELPIALRTVCAGIVCDPASTCFEGACVTATLPDPTSCTDPGGCAGGHVDGGPTPDAAATDAGDAGDAGGALEGGACGNADLLKDAANCGECGHDCLGAACVAGFCAPSVVATGGTSVLGLAVDGTSLYWLEIGTTGPDGRIMHAPKTGGGGTALVSGLNLPGVLALDDAHVFYTEVIVAKVRSVLKSGAGDTVLQPSGGTNVGPIAVDATRVFYMNTPGTSTLTSMTKSGGGITPIPIPGATVGIALDATYLYYATAQAGGAGSVYRADKTGAQPTVVGTTSSDPSAAVHLTAGPALLAWTDTKPPVLHLQASTGSRTVSVALPAPAMDLAVDGTNAYVLMSGGTGQGIVWRVAFTSTLATVLAETLTRPVSMAVDATHVYIGEQSDGTIRKLAK